MSIFYGTEEEIRQYGAELEIALESIDTHTSNLHRIEDLITKVKMNGVDRVTMETLCSIYPEVMPENAMPYMFTLEASHVHMEYAQEGFFEAVGEAIKWIFKQIIEALKAIFSMFVSFFNWLLGNEEKSKKSSKRDDKETERLEKERQNILDEYQEGLRLFEELSDDRKKKIDLSKVEKIELMFNKDYLTELDYLILIQADGYGQDNLEKIITVIATIMEGGYNNYARAVEAYIKIIKNKLYGTDVTSNLNRMKDAMFYDIEAHEDTPYFALPYNYRYLETILEGAGVGIPSHIKTKIKHDSMYNKQIEIVYGTEEEEKRNIFWAGSAKPGIKGQKADITHLAKRWGKDKDNALFFLPYYEQSFTIKNVKLDGLQALKKLKVEHLEKQKDKIEDSLKTIEKELNNFMKNMDSYIKDYNETMMSNWMENRGSSPFTSVWPPSFGNYNAGDDLVPRVPKDKKEAEELEREYEKMPESKLPYVNVMIVHCYRSSQMLPYWTTIRRPIRFLMGGMIDILATINRYNALHKLITDDTEARKKIYDQIKKEHEKQEKDY